MEAVTRKTQDVCSQRGHGPRELAQKDAWRGRAVCLGLLMNVLPSRVAAQIWNFIIRGAFLKGRPSVRGKAAQPNSARDQTSVTVSHPRLSPFSSEQTEAQI